MAGVDGAAFRACSSKVSCINDGVLPTSPNSLSADEADNDGANSIRAPKAAKLATAG